MLMYKKIIRPLLFALPIERAHRLVVVLLRIVGMIPAGRWLLDTCFAIRHPALEREVFGCRFANPVGVAAGFDPNGEVCRELGAVGFGFVEVGTVTPLPQSGNPRPRVFRLQKDRAFISRMGMPNRGLKKTIQYLRRPHEGVIVGCNIGCNATTPVADAPADYLKLFRNLYQYADYFTVNLCCEHVGGEHLAHQRDYILGILEPLFDFRRGQNQYRPVMLKISPDLSDEEIDTVTDILIETPLDGIVASNGTQRRKGLHTSHASLAKIGGGRLTGPTLTERTIEIVRRVHTRSGGTYPIIGVGGMMSVSDVQALLAAGADLVQLYTGYVYEGPRLVRDICRTLIAEAAPKPTKEPSEPPQEPAVAESSDRNLHGETESRSVDDVQKQDDGLSR